MKTTTNTNAKGNEMTTATKEKEMTIVRVSYDSQTGLWYAATTGQIIWAAKGGRRIDAISELCRQLHTTADSLMILD